MAGILGSGLRVERQNRDVVGVLRVGVAGNARNRSTGKLNLVPRCRETPGSIDAERRLLEHVDRAAPDRVGQDDDAHHVRNEVGVHAADADDAGLERRERVAGDGGEALVQDLVGYIASRFRQDDHVARADPQRVGGGGVGRNVRYGGDRRAGNDGNGPRLRERSAVVRERRDRDDRRGRRPGRRGEAGPRERGGNAGRLSSGPVAVVGQHGLDGRAVVDVGDGEREVERATGACGEDEPGCGEGLGARGRRRKRDERVDSVAVADANAKVVGRVGRKTGDGKSRRRIQRGIDFRAGNDGCEIGHGRRFQPHRRRFGAGSEIGCDGRRVQRRVAGRSKGGRSNRGAGNQRRERDGAERSRVVLAVRDRTADVVGCPIGKPGCRDGVTTGSIDGDVRRLQDRREGAVFGELDVERRRGGIVAEEKYRHACGGVGVLDRRSRQGRNWGVGLDVFLGGSERQESGVRLRRPVRRDPVGRHCTAAQTHLVHGTIEAAALVAGLILWISLGGTANADVGILLSDWWIRRYGLHEDSVGIDVDNRNVAVARVLPDNINFFPDAVVLLQHRANWVRCAIEIGTIVEGVIVGKNTHIVNRLASDIVTAELNRPRIALITQASTEEIAPLDVGIVSLGGLRHHPKGGVEV